MFDKLIFNILGIALIVLFILTAGFVEDAPLISIACAIALAIVGKLISRYHIED